MFFVSCPACGQKYRIPDRKAGKKMRCLKCGLRFVIGSPHANKSEVVDQLSRVIGNSNHRLHAIPRDSGSRDEPGELKERGCHQRHLQLRLICCRPMRSLPESRCRN